MHSALDLSTDAHYNRETCLRLFKGEQFLATNRNFSRFTFCGANQQLDTWLKTWWRSH